MVGLLSLDSLQDSSCSKLFSVCLVIEIYGFVERERIEDRRLVIVRVALGQLRHRRLISERTRAQINLVIILEIKGKCLDPVVLALRFGGDGASRLDRLPTVLHKFGGEGSDEGIWALADR